MTKSFSLFGYRVTWSAVPEPFDYRGWTCTYEDARGGYGATWKATAPYITLRRSTLAALKADIDRQLARAAEDYINVRGVRLPPGYKVHYMKDRK